MASQLGSTATRLASSKGGGGSHASSIKLWKNLSFFVGIPAIALGMANAYMGHQEDHHKPRPEFVPYEHLRRRTKRFPWGDGNKSLFHNPHVNALPNGYEDEIKKREEEGAE